MTLVLDMPEHVERRLRERAAEAGVDMETYSLRAIERDLDVAPAAHDPAPILTRLDSLLREPRRLFAESGMTDDELAELFEREKHESRNVPYPPE